MRRVYLFNMISLDGYFEGTEPWELSWHTVDDEFNRFAEEQLRGTDMIVFGRKTFEGMAQYWPTEQGKADDPVIAGLMNSIQKIVVSTTLTDPPWENSRVVSRNAAETIAELKRQPGKDIAIFGSATLASSVKEVIDEYRILIAPVVLGGGRTLFPPSGGRFNLNVSKVRTFNNGNILLYYTPRKK